MPAPGIATQPRRMDLLCQRFCSFQPMLIEVIALFEIDVQKMISRRSPRLRPAPHARVQAAFEIAAVFIEVDEVGVILLHPRSINSLGRDLEFTRQADTESRQSRDAFSICCHATIVSESVPRALASVAPGANR